MGSGPPLVTVTLGSAGMWGLGMLATYCWMKVASSPLSEPVPAMSPMIVGSRSG